MKAADIVAALLVLGAVIVGTNCSFDVSTPAPGANERFSGCYQGSASAAPGFELTLFLTPLTIEGFPDDDVGLTGCFRRERVSDGVVVVFSIVGTVRSEDRDIADLAALELGGGSRSDILEATLLPSSSSADMSLVRTDGVPIMGQLSSCSPTPVNPCGED